MWKKISIQEVKNLKVGDPILVNGTVTSVAGVNKIPGSHPYFTTYHRFTDHLGLSQILFYVDFWDKGNSVSIYEEPSNPEGLTNTLFDESYPDYETAVTNEVLVDFVELNVNCEHYGFIEKLLEVLTHEQCKELVKTIFHLEPTS